jgi:hypothetical protein
MVAERAVPLSGRLTAAVELGSAGSLETGFEDSRGWAPVAAVVKF